MRSMCGEHNGSLKGTMARMAYRLRLPRSCLDYLECFSLRCPEASCGRRDERADGRPRRRCRRSSRCPRSSRPCVACVPWPAGRPPRTRGSGTPFGRVRLPHATRRAWGCALRHGRYRRGSTLVDGSCSSWRSCRLDDQCHDCGWVCGSISGARPWWRRASRRKEECGAQERGGNAKQQGKSHVVAHMLAQLGVRCHGIPFPSSHPLAVEIRPCPHCLVPTIGWEGVVRGCVPRVGIGAQDTGPIRSGGQ